MTLYEPYSRDINMSHELNIPKAYMRRVEQGLESIPDGLPETLGLNWAESSGMMRQKSARRSAVQSPSTLRGFLPASPISTSIVWRISVIRRINLYTVRALSLHCHLHLSFPEASIATPAANVSDPHADRLRSWSRHLGLRCSPPERHV